MSAAASQPWKNDGDKDRRTRMVTSSVNQPIKKDGAGGHSWGSPTDVTDFLPVGAGGAKVIVGAPITAPTVVSQAMQANVGDATQFPGLGSATYHAAPGASAWSAAPAVIRAAPPPAVKVAPAVRMAQKAAPIVIQAGTMVGEPAPSSPTGGPPTVVLNQDTNRPGAAGIYDATHPRNQFARKPRIAPGGQIVVVAQDGTQPAAASAAAAPGEAPAVDWTQAGTVGIQTQIIHAAAANPAHLGLYQEAKPGPSVSDMKLIPQTVTIPANTNPKQMVATRMTHKMTPKQHQPGMLQARGR